MALAVPVKLIVVPVPEQIVAAPLIVAVGRAFTVTSTDPDNVCEQMGTPEELILTRLYVALALRLPVDTVALPEASTVIVWFAPPLTV